MRIIEEDERELCPHVRLIGQGKRCTVLDCFEPVHDMAAWAEEGWNLAGVAFERAAAMSRHA